MGKIHFQYSYIGIVNSSNKELYKNLCGDRYPIDEVESTGIESEVTCSFCLRAIKEKDSRYKEYLIRKGVNCG